MTTVAGCTSPRVAVADDVLGEVCHGTSFRIKKAAITKNKILFACCVLAILALTDRQFLLAPVLSNNSNNPSLVVYRNKNDPPTEATVATISSNNDDRGIDNIKPPIRWRMPVCRFCNTTTINHTLLLNNRRTSTQPIGAFMHVGKTAGRTIATNLLRNGCPLAARPRPCHTIINESFVSRTTEYLHMADYNHLMASSSSQQKEYAFYIFTLREPLARTISAFCYMHTANREARTVGQILPRYKRIKPRLKQKFKCFPTLERFTELLSWNSTAAAGNDDDGLIIIDGWNCTQLAKESMESRDEDLGHFFYDFKKSWEVVPNKETSTILSVRAEYLWDDWVAINEFLGQTNVSVLTSDARENDYSGIDLPISKDLSEIGKQRLCLALRDEYMAYLTIVHRSVNLSPTDKLEALDMSRKSCPWLQLEFDFSSSEYAVR